MVFEGIPQMLVLLPGYVTFDSTLLFLGCISKSCPRLAVIVYRRDYESSNVRAKSLDRLVSNFKIGLYIDMNRPRFPPRYSNGWGMDPICGNEDFIEKPQI